MLGAGVVILALAVAPVIMNPGGSGDATACNPNQFTDADLARMFRGHPDMNGRSWATPYTFIGNSTSGWTLWETESYILIQDCTFNGSAWGLRLWETQHVQVINCTFAGATRGIWGHLARDLLVMESSFLDNGYGIDLWRVSNATILRNEFVGNGLGIRASSCCGDVVGYYNHFDVETFAAAVESPSVLLQKNFYADYFANHPAATINLADPEAGYCSPGEGMPFPLSEPVTLGYLGVDARPLWWAPNVDPSITIIRPVQGAYYRAPPVLEVTLGGTVIANASYIFGGLQFVLALPLTFNHAGTTSVIVDASTFAALAEGELIILVGVTSWFGVTKFSPITIQKDTLMPIVSLQYPANFSLHAAPPTICLNASDASPLNASYTCAGSTLLATLPSFTVDATLWASQPEDDIIVEVNIEDSAGNSASLTATYRKDVTGPMITAAWVGTIGLTGVVPPSFDLTATDPAGLSGSIQCSVNGAIWNVPSGSTTQIPNAAYVALPDGPFCIMIVAHDTLNNPASITLDGEKDSVFDTLEVLAPLTGTVVSASVVPYFAIRVEDSHGVVSTWVSLDGGMTQYNITSAGYLPPSEWTTTVILGGAVSVTVTFGAMDAAGNNASVSVILTVTPSNETPSNGECTEWWCSAVFWAGMSVGMLVMAVMLAIKGTSMGRQDHFRVKRVTMKGRQP